jgi:hypothetical protein
LKGGLIPMPDKKKEKITDLEEFRNRKNSEMEESDDDLSQVILEYAEPLLENTETYEDEQEAIGRSVAFWNLCMYSKEESKELMEEFLTDVVTDDDDPEYREDFINYFDEMYERKQLPEFVDDRRVVVDFIMEDCGDSFSIAVFTDDDDEEEN